MATQEKRFFIPAPVSQPFVPWMDLVVVEGYRPGGEHGATLRVEAPLSVAGRDLAYYDPSNRPLWLEVDGPARLLKSHEYLELYRIWWLKAAGYTSDPDEMVGIKYDQTIRANEIWRLYHMLTLMEFETRHIFSALCTAVHAKKRSHRVPPGYLDELRAHGLLDDTGRVSDELHAALEALTERRQDEAWTVVNPWPPKD